MSVIIRFSFSGLVKLPLCKTENGITGLADLQRRIPAHPRIPSLLTAFPDHNRLKPMSSATLLPSCRPLPFHLQRSISTTVTTHPILQPPHNVPTTTSTSNFHPHLHPIMFKRTQKSHQHPAFISSQVYPLEATTFISSEQVCCIALALLVKEPTDVESKPDFSQVSWQTP
jgi:hypothetical protein